MAPKEQRTSYLLVAAARDGLLVDLDEAAALPQPRLPRVPEVLHLRDQPVVLDVEPELPQLVPPQAELLAGRPGTDGLQPGRDLVQVLGLPVLDVDDDALALQILFC